MIKVSRNNNLKLPKIIKAKIPINNKKDALAVKYALATAHNKKVNKEDLIKEIEKDIDLERVTKIREDANDLIVVTKAKKLTAYVFAITEKSPAKYRNIFINRMHNLCLDTLEMLLEANFVRLDSLENKKRRERYQKDAIIKLKMLGYISMLAENSNCILVKQYKQISLQIGDVINLAAAWKKSDDVRFRKNRVLS
jgi:hypothetical protein